MSLPGLIDSGWLKFHLNYPDASPINSVLSSVLCSHLIECHVVLHFYIKTSDLPVYLRFVGSESILLTLDQMVL